MALRVGAISVLILFILRGGSVCDLESNVFQSSGELKVGRIVVKLGSPWTVADPSSNLHDPGQHVTEFQLLMDLKRE